MKGQLLNTSKSSNNTYLYAEQINILYGNVSVSMMERLLGEREGKLTAHSSK